MPLFWGCVRGGAGSGCKPFSLCVCSLRAGHCPHRLQGQSQAFSASLLDLRNSCNPLPPTSWTPGPQELSQADGASHLDARSGRKLLLPPPSQTPGVVVSCYAPITCSRGAPKPPLPPSRTPGPGTSHHMCTPPFQGITTNTH